MTARIKVPTRVVLPVGQYTRGGTWHRTATTGRWARKGNLYLERREGVLFVARHEDGPYVRVPDWALLAYQWIPQSEDDLREFLAAPLWNEPGRQRQRRATKGEAELLAIVTLRQLGKNWPEIQKFLGISREVLEQRREEIIRTIRDLDQLGNQEKLQLKMCQALKDEWKGHAIGGRTTGKQTPSRRLDWTDEQVEAHHFSRGAEAAREAVEREATEEAERDQPLVEVK